MNPNKKKTSDANDEVEELLRAAEDAALLKLSVNSHNVHASPSDLDPDLDKRFRELRSGTKLKGKQESRTKKMPTPKTDKVNEEVVEEDELLARFAALKASVPKPSSSSLLGVETSGTSFGDELGDGSSGGQGNIDDDEEDEVEKVIRWAMDAARLDPSPSSDDEEAIKDIYFDGNDDGDGDDDESHETSDEEDAKNSRKNSKRKQK